MTLENKLNITDAVELARVEEKLSKAKAHRLFTSGFLDGLVEDWSQVDKGDYLLAIGCKVLPLDVFVQGSIQK
ncbi:MAG: hypothetical protein KUG82_00495 [Pseudomonadales bacterium]|nr:hypothetical protein [Pseudomonadales bacterium]